MPKPKPKRGKARQTPVVKRSKRADLEAIVASQRADLIATRTENTRLKDEVPTLRVLSERIQQIGISVTRLDPVSVKEQWATAAKADLEAVEKHFPALNEQYNAMAEAVNKIVAYARAMDEYGSGLKKLTRKYIRMHVRRLAGRQEETDTRLVRLRHRLKRMEQKL